jgi:hypothetical protein
LACIFPHHGAHILSVLEKMFVGAGNEENQRRTGTSAWLSKRPQQSNGLHH